MMKTLRLLFIFVLLAAPILGVSRAAAQGTAPVVGGVQPNVVSNEHASTLTITGSGFGTAAGATVSLDGYAAPLTTTWISDTQLNALAPVGVPAGVYAVVVTLAGGEVGRLDNALTVTTPSATPTATATPTLTLTPGVSRTPTDDLPPTASHTPVPTNFVRPMIVVQSYGASAQEIVANQNLDFEMTFENVGQLAASNIVATFSVGDFAPRATGGVRAINPLNPGQSARIFQPLVTSAEVSGKNVATLEVKLAYTDIYGNAYSENFTLTFAVFHPTRAPGAGRPTATPTFHPVFKPQLLVTQYSTDVGILQAGGQFRLTLEIRNAGNVTARRVTAIIGGGTGNTGSGDNNGTPSSSGNNGDNNNGISGASGEFSNFAPVNSSNIQFLGDVEVTRTVTLQQDLIVNASTEPGAYTLKLSFNYQDDKQVNYTDDQVITLLVYRLPQVQIGFYSEVMPATVGMPSPLPIQITNLGRNSSVLGTLKVSAADETVQFNNNSTIIGLLDTGGYFPLDAIVIPSQPGPLELLVTVDYMDDFNRPRVITQTLTVEVMPASEGEGAKGDGQLGNDVPDDLTLPKPETFLEKVGRFLLGLLGLDSGRPETPRDILPATPPPSDKFIAPPGPKG